MEESRENGCCSSCHLILHQPYIGKRIYTDASAIFFRIRLDEIPRKILQNFIKNKPLISEEFISSIV